MGFTWECDGNTFEEKGMIEDSLPEGFGICILKEEDQDGYHLGM